VKKTLHFFSLANMCRLSFAPMISLSTDVKPMAVRAADFNNDTFLDLAVANYIGSTTSIFLGNGNGSFRERIDLYNGANAGTNGLAIGDINKDNRLDIVVVNRKASSVGIFFGKGDGSFSQQMSFSTGNGSTPVELALDDLNNDTILDLVVTDHENGLLPVFLGSGDGTFMATQTLSTGNTSGPYFIVINDFNKDDRLDIAVGAGDGDHLDIFFGDGTGHFPGQTSYYIESGPYALVVSDFNRDGVLDIVTANYYGNNTSVLVGNNDGIFTRKNTFSTGIDFDGNNLQDLIVPNSGTDNVGILLGYGNGKFIHQKTFSTGIGSGPVDVAIGDLNGDKRVDFVSANNNHNTLGVFLSTCS
jgi:hypothetical protein